MKANNPQRNRVVDTTIGRSRRSGADDRTVNRARLNIERELVDKMAENLGEAHPDVVAARRRLRDLERGAGVPLREIRCVQCYAYRLSNIAVCPNCKSAEFTVIE